MSPSVGIEKEILAQKSWINKQNGTRLASQQTPLAHLKQPADADRNGMLSNQSRAGAAFLTTNHKAGSGQCRSEADCTETMQNVCRG